MISDPPKLKKSAPGKENTLLGRSVPPREGPLQETLAQKLKKLSEYKRNTAKSPANLTSHHYQYRWAGRLPIVRADQLREREYHFEFLPFLGLSGIIPKGYSIILAGYPKTGKTELSTELVIEWAKLGEKIFYISEEPESIWTERLHSKSGRIENIYISCALGKSPREILESIRKTDISIIVIDTLRNLIGLDNENDNSEIARVLNPYISAARQKNKTIFFLHHTRKGGGYNGEAISGGHAFLGSVDVALELRKDEKSENRRIVKGSGRVVQIPEIVFERNADSTYKLLGSPDLLRLDNVCERIESVLTTTWLTTAEIRNNISDPKPSDEQLRLGLNKLAADRKIERNPPLNDGSKPGITYRWRLAATRGGVTYDR